MARQDEAPARPDASALREAAALLLPLGGFITLALFLVAGAANLGFYDAFGIQDLRLVGVDKSAVIDHALVFGVMLAALFGTLFSIALVVVAVAGSDAPAATAERSRRRFMAEAVVVSILLAACVVAITLIGFRGAVPAAMLLGAAWVVRSKSATAADAAREHPWHFFGVGAAVVALGTVGAFLQGSAWGGDVRQLRRTTAPTLGFALIVQWPHGAVLDAAGPEPASTACTDEILLGRSGGNYVLYNVRIERLHEVPTAQRLSRIGIGAVKRSGCRGPAGPASAR